jgi:hypothetical protein
VIRQSEASIVNKIELATLAGFFAGEGSITLSSGKWPTMYAALGNSESFWVTKFRDLFGGAFYVESPKYFGAKHMFRWRVCGKHAAKFLESIQPYLVGEKAEQLVLALAFQKAKDEHNSGSKITRELRSEMDRFIESMKALRRTAAETNRKDAAPLRSDSPIL